MSQFKEAGLTTIADGVAIELFKHEIAKVASNIADPNTAATAKRKITMTFEFAPDQDREEVKVLVGIKTNLESIKGYSKTVHMGKLNGKPTIYSTDQKQIDLFDQNVTGITQKKAGN